MLILIAYAYSYNMLILAYATRSGHPEMLLKITVLKNFENDNGKHLCWSLFFNRIADLRYASLLNWDSCTGVFVWILKTFSAAVFSTLVNGYFWFSIMHHKLYLQYLKRSFNSRFWNVLTTWKLESKIWKTRKLIWHVCNILN